MDQAAADRVKQIRERQERIDNAAREHECEEPEFHPCEICAEWQALIHAQLVNAHHEIPLLLSQLSASEERVRALEKGLGACIEQLKWNWLCEAGRNGLRMTYPELVEKYGKNKTIELAESLLPSPPQVIRG